MQRVRQDPDPLRPETRLINGFFEVGDDVWVRLSSIGLVFKRKYTEIPDKWVILVDGQEVIVSEKDIKDIKQLIEQGYA